MDYKKIIPTRQLRFKILSLLKKVPDKIMLNIQYYLKHKRKINWDNPQRFTEWIQWYKINYRNPLMINCVDKFLVREYIKGKGLENILNPYIGVFDKAEDINFETLPEKFVVKTTDGGGGNNVIICKNKKNLDTTRIKLQLNSWLNLKNINAGREWAYTGIKKSQIIIEKLIENDKFPKKDIEDFKFFCFGGQPKIISLDMDRFHGHKRNFYDIEWNRIYVDSDCEQKETEVKKPENFEAMLQITRKLSEDFPFVRVDLYNINGKIIFGELTFYPWSGYVKFTPDSFDYDLGKMFKNIIFNNTTYSPIN